MCMCGEWIGEGEGEPPEQTLLEEDRDYKKGALFWARQTAVFFSIVSMMMEVAERRRECACKPRLGGVDGSGGGRRGVGKRLTYAFPANGVRRRLHTVELGQSGQVGRRTNSQIVRVFMFSANSVP